MPRARNIKPGFFANDTLADCTPLARLLFIGLWCLADRNGVLLNRPRRIKAEALPYDDCDPIQLIGELIAGGFVAEFESGGTRYLFIPTFEKHQKPHKNELEQHPKPEPLGPKPEPLGPKPTALALNEDRGMLNVECGMRNEEDNVTSPSDVTAKSRTSRKTTTTLFDEFWESYPRRNGVRKEKTKAATEFRKLAEPDMRLAIAAAQRYGESGELPKDAFRWLKGGWREWLGDEVFEAPPPKPGERGFKPRVLTADELANITVADLQG